MGATVNPATYAIYRGDEFIDVGTADELARRHGIKKESIRWMASPAYKRRGGYGKLAVYKIEEEEGS